MGIGEHDSRVIPVAAPAEILELAIRREDTRDRHGRLGGLGICAATFRTVFRGLFIPPQSASADCARPDWLLWGGDVRSSASAASSDPSRTLGTTKWEGIPLSKRPDNKTAIRV